MSIKPRNVLVVDDDPIIRDMMIDILEFEGYTIETARNGREALEKLQREDSSYLVFLDLMMPTMDGHEFCQRLDAMPQVRSRHILILMSALDKMDEAHKLHIDAVMPKPFVVDDILRAIKPYME